jgi:S1-C subfamily serine protease
MQKWIVLFITLTLVTLEANVPNSNDVKTSIVKIFTVANVPNHEAPWSSKIRRSSGSGCIIEGHTILTNAHVVTNATYLEVLKYGETKRYEAKVLHIAHDSDLALITVKDKRFFEHTQPLPFRELPQLQDTVSVYGFPTGGETLSITKGVVSRIEHQLYVHNLSYLLAIQIDAAVNSGNSGGPALVDGKIVGLVMQGKRRSQNIGYIIPTCVIEHFLKDIQDGHYNGYGLAGITIQTMENPALRKMYHIENLQHGVLITNIIPHSPASKVLEKGDIITAIDGYKIMTNGKVAFRKGEFTNFSYPIQKHQLGETITCEIVRKGKMKQVSITLNATNQQLSLYRTQPYVDHPSYYIYGGLVFMPLYDREKIPTKYLEAYPDENRTELVTLTKVLDSELTKGFNHLEFSVIESINGKLFKDFSTFVGLLEDIKEKFVVFEDTKGRQIVLESQQVSKMHKTILKRYAIKTDRSKNLQESQREKVLAKSKIAQ